MAYRAATGSAGAGRDARDLGRRAPPGKAVRDQLADGGAELEAMAREPGEDPESVPPFDDELLALATRL